MKTILIMIITVSMLIADSIPTTPVNLNVQKTDTVYIKVEPVSYYDSEVTPVDIMLWGGMLALIVSGISALIMTSNAQID